MLSVQEAGYAYCGNVFAQHFLNRLGPAYTALRQVLDESDPAQAAVLSGVRARFRQETFTRASILETLQRYPELVRLAVRLCWTDGARSACCTSALR